MGKIIDQALEEWKAQAGPESPSKPSIYFTGHSLGGPGSISLLPSAFFLLPFADSSSLSLLSLSLMTSRQEFFCPVPFTRAEGQVLESSRILFRPACHRQCRVHQHDPEALQRCLHVHQPVRFRALPSTDGGGTPPTGSTPCSLTTTLLSSRKSTRLIIRWRSFQGTCSCPPWGTTASRPSTFPCPGQRREGRTPTRLASTSAMSASAATGSARTPAQGFSNFFLVIHFFSFAFKKKKKKKKK